MFNYLASATSKNKIDLANAGNNFWVVGWKKMSKFVFDYVNELLKILKESNYY